MHIIGIFFKKAHYDCGKYLNLKPISYYFRYILLKNNEKVPKIIYNMRMICQFLRKIKILVFIVLCMSLSFTYASDYSDFYESLFGPFYDLTDPNAGSTVFRSLTIPLGGRSEAMGTAYTAMTDDIAAIAYNPAISAVLPNTEVSVYHNFWIADSAIDTIAFSQRNTNLGFGASLKSFYVPFSEYSIVGERVSSGYYSETTGMINVSYNFLAGYHFKGLSLGTNLKFAYRGIPDYTDDTTNEIILNSGLEQSAIAVMGDIGLLFRFNAGKLYSSREPNLNVGLAVTNLGAAFTSLSTDIELDDALPTQAAIGVSYKMIRPITLSVDFIQPFNILDLSKTEQFAVGFGIEGTITDFFSLQGGFLLKGGNPKISLGSEVDWKSLTFSLSYSLDLTTSLTPVNRISLSAKLNLGDKGRAELQDTVDSLYTQGLNYYVNGEFTQAISVWEEALLLYPLFDPAIDGIKAANDSILLRTTIQQVQSLDVEKTVE